MDTVSMGVTPIARSISSLVSKRGRGPAVKEPTSETVQSELVDLRKRLWVLPIVLDDIDVIRDSKETGESRSL